MFWSRVLVVALSGALLAGPAWAQDDDDDLLAPLSKKKEPKHKPKAKPKPKPARPPPAASSEDELAPLVPSKGELTVKLAASATTRRAKVSIDDREIGTLPVAPQSLSPGEHTVSVRAPGYAPWTKKVTVVSNKPTEVTVPLEATAALLSVTSDESGAQVLINGKLVGTAPIAELELPPGQATIAVRKEGHREATQLVKLIAGREYPITVKLGPAIPPTTIVATETDRPEQTDRPDLTPDRTEEVAVSTRVEPSAPVYQQWYFWAGAVAVVAAVAVGSAVAVNNAQPRPLGEAKICGPTGCDACIGFTCTIFPSGIVPFKF